MREAKLALAALATSRLVLVATGSTLAGPLTYTLPSQTATLKKASGRGYEKAEKICSACHSVDYISTQQPGKGKDFWTTEVNKMVRPMAPPSKREIAPQLSTISRQTIEHPLKRSRRCDLVAVPDSRRHHLVHRSAKLDDATVQGQDLIAPGLPDAPRQLIEFTGAGCRI